VKLAVRAALKREEKEHSRKQGKELRQSLVVVPSH
jgi:hypothetical protein